MDWISLFHEDRETDTTTSLVPVPRKNLEFKFFFANDNMLQLCLFHLSNCKIKMLLSVSKSSNFGGEQCGNKLLRYDSVLGRRKIKLEAGMKSLPAIFVLTWDCKREVSHR
jgi:hypothetical protein